MGTETKLDANELAALAKVFKMESHRRTNYSDEYKQMVVHKILVDHESVIPFSEKLGIHKQTVYNWISKFAGEKPSCKLKEAKLEPKEVTPMPQKKANPVETPEQELERLRAENKRLSEALKLSEWSNHAKDVMIDLAEKTFNIPIKKNSGVK